jgi:hypothetical protein
MLSAQRGLDTSLHAQINERKQAHTVELLTDVHESSALVAVFRHFKQLGFPASRAAVRLHWLAASERACAAVGRSGGVVGVVVRRCLPALALGG